MQSTVLMCIIGALLGGAMGMAHFSADGSAGMQTRPRIVSHFARFDAQFDAADRDGDGALTRREVMQAGMSGVTEQFERIDADRDGRITREELLSLIPSKISS